MISVSIFNKVDQIYGGSLASVESLFYCIKTGGSIKGLINEIRNNPMADKKALKRKLPVIMWQGVFSHRKDNGIQSLSSLMCIDIDHKTEQELSNLRTSLIDEPWVMAVFRSPSGDGMKVIVKTDNYDPSIYKNCYCQLEDLFLKRYGIKPDNNCEPLSQGCFASYDPDIYVNPDAQDLHLQYDPAYDKEKNITQSAVLAYTYQPEAISMTDRFLGMLGNGLSDEDIIEIADKRFARYPRRYMDGYRTKSIFTQASALCKAGIPMEKTLVYLKANYLPTGFDEYKLEHEVGQAYSKNASSFGIERGNYRP